MAKKTQPEVNNEIMGKIVAMLKEHNRAEENTIKQQQYSEPTQPVQPQPVAPQVPVMPQPPIPPKELRQDTGIKFKELGTFLRGTIVVAWFNLVIFFIFILLLLASS